MNDHQFIVKDIKDHYGLNSDLPPSVAREYKEYEEKQAAASDERYENMLRQQHAQEAHLRLQAGGMRNLERKGFSSHNELTRRYR